MEAYFSDIRWGYHYLRGSGPANLEFVMALAGYRMPRLRAACELAFGQGLTVNINAATGMGTDWHGTDFNPAHAEAADRLAASCKNRATIHDRSFADFRKTPDLPQFDLIILSGTWSWISDEDRQDIIGFLDSNLAAGGLFIVHYEALPGALDHGHLRNLILSHTAAETLSGSEMADRVPALIKDLRQAVQLNPTFMGDYPDIDNLLAEMETMPPDHVAHEYFNRHWKPFRFAEVAAMLNPVGLRFACALDPQEHVDAIHLTEPQKDHLAGLADDNIRESVRDFFIRRSSRTDCWVKAPERLSPEDRLDRLRRLGFMRVKDRPPEGIPVYGALGEFALAEPDFKAIIDAFPLGEITDMGAIVQRLPVSSTFDELSDCIALLVAARLIEPVPINHSPSDEEIACSRALNTELTRIAAGGEDISTFAAPALAGGFSIATEDQPFLFASLSGASEPDELAAAAEVWLAARDTHQKTGENANRHHTLRAQADTFVQDTLPIFRRLAIL